MNTINTGFAYRVVGEPGNNARDVFVRNNHDGLYTVMIGLSNGTVREAGQFDDLGLAEMYQNWVAINYNLLAREDQQVTA